MHLLIDLLGISALCVAVFLAWCWLFVIDGGAVWRWVGRL